jgi:hypothetical protein
MSEESKVLRFDNCPACHSADRLVGALSEGEKANGHMRPNIEFYINTIGGIITDKALAGTKLIGSSAPAYSMSFDVCTNCGCMYAVKIEIGKATLSILPQRGSPPLFMGKG